VTQKECRLAEQPGREGDAEAAYLNAISANTTDAHVNLGLLLAGQPARVAEGEAALRAALAAGDGDAWPNLAWLLSRQPERRDEALFVCRQAIAAGHTVAALYLGVLLAVRWGRNLEQEAAYRQAMACDNADVASNAAARLGVLLDLRGDVAGAIACYEFAVERGPATTGECANCHLGWLRAYLGDKAGARAALESAGRDAMARISAQRDVDMSDVPVARIAAIAAALGHGRITRKPMRALHLAIFRARRAIKKGL